MEEENLESGKMAITDRRKGLNRAKEKFQHGKLQFHALTE
jgi:hypothetical protein